ncbi:unnamed protein product [Penicillium palitans]
MVTSSGDACLDQLAPSHNFSIQHILIFILAVGVGAVAFVTSWVCGSMFVLPLWARMSDGSPPERIASLLGVVLLATIFAALIGLFVSET